MRKKREWYKGAMYHVMNSGRSHQDIFLQDEDYEYFMLLLRYVKKKFPFEMHAYCLMTNHYHFLIETKEDEIWTIMKQIGELYVRYYNTKYGKDGSLFRSRYHAILVKEDDYFLQINRYITLNPLKAGMVTAAEHYQWSSYQTYLGLADDKLTQIDKTLAYFHDNNRLRYQNFIEEHVSHVDFEKQIQKEMKEDDLWLPW